MRRWFNDQLNTRSGWREVPEFRKNCVLVTLDPEGNYAYHSKVVQLNGRGHRAHNVVVTVTDTETCVDLWHKLWGCTKPGTTAIIQRFQNIVLRNIFDAPW